MDSNATGLQVLTWNINGLQSKFGALKTYVYTEDVDVLCLQETRCAAGTYVLSGYTCVESPSTPVLRIDGLPRSHARGLRIYVKKDVPYQPLDVPLDDDTTDAHAITITLKASPDYLWGASILLSVGGNTIRMAGLQLGNLFPQRRNTAMAIISGIFTPSAGLFMVLQSMFEKGLKWEDVCMGCSAVTFLIILFTPLFPRHHVPYGDVSETTETENTEKKRDEKPGGPLSSSIISVSSFLYLFWLFNNLFAVVLFGTYFNSWINKFSKTEEEAGFYSRLFGYANLLCALVTPLPGLMVDCISSVLKRGKSEVMAQVASVQAMIVPMFIVSTTITLQLSTLLFPSSAAVYVGLICLIINRPSCQAVAIPFVRARFPAEHFNRIIGIQGTVIAVLTMLQYPHFTFAQSHYNLAMGVMVGVLMLTLAQPLHLLNKSYLARALTPTSRSPESSSLM